jgi:radical SAM/Cys-rich protein
MEATAHLNSLGYGAPESGLILNLVYNPGGAFAAPRQASIEADFRRELRRREGVSFNNLFVITNMPIGRFYDFLVESGNLKGYMERLKGSFNPGAVEGLMCRTTLSVASDGALYDCDFNRVLGLKSALDDPIIDAFNGDPFNEGGGRAIVTYMHCYGCTAGAGSSCGGETT